MKDFDNYKNQSIKLLKTMIETIEDDGLLELEIGKYNSDKGDVEYKSVRIDQIIFDTHSPNKIIIKGINNL